LAHQAQVHPQSIDLGLERLERVLDRLHWRQPSLPVITVAGTNGKGSVVAYCRLPDRHVHIAAFARLSRAHSRA